MNASQWAGVLEALIPIGGGLMCTLYGLRKLGKPPGADPKFDAWHAKVGGFMKVGGPFLILFGLWQTGVAMMGPASGPVRPLGESTLYPLRVGTTWVYRIGEGEVRSRVVGHAVHEGAAVARLAFEHDGRVLREIWVHVDGPSVFHVALDGKTYQPRLPILVAGPPRSWDYRSGNGKIALRVEQSEGGPVTTPAGAWSQSTKVVVKGSDSGGETELITWYVEGLGPVKESSRRLTAAAAMELKSFTPGP